MNEAGAARVMLLDERLPAGRSGLAAALAELGIELVPAGAAVADVALLFGPLEDVRERLAGLSSLALLVIGDADDRETVFATLGAGADGYVSATSTDAQLAAAVRVVAAGHTIVPRAARSAVARPAFTAREKQILSLVVLGSSNREIATRLFIAESTVKMHMTNILSKLGVRSRNEAVQIVLDPASGLGLGIVSITQGSQVQVAYGKQAAN